MKNFGFKYEFFCNKNYNEVYKIEDLFVIKKSFIFNFLLVIMTLNSLKAYDKMITTKVKLLKIH